MELFCSFFGVFQMGTKCALPVFSAFIFCSFTRCKKVSWVMTLFVSPNNPLILQCVLLIRSRKSRERILASSYNILSASSKLIGSTCSVLVILASILIATLITEYTCGVKAVRFDHLRTLSNSFHFHLQKQNLEHHVRWSADAAQYSSGVC